MRRVRKSLLIKHVVEPIHKESSSPPRYQPAIRPATTGPHLLPLRRDELPPQPLQLRKPDAADRHTQGGLSLIHI